MYSRGNKVYTIVMLVYINVFVWTKGRLHIEKLKFKPFSKMTLKCTVLHETHRVPQILTVSYVSKCSVKMYGTVRFTCADKRVSKVALKVI
jgi:hypothetical protein